MASPHPPLPARARWRVPALAGAAIISASLCLLSLTVGTLEVSILEAVFGLLGLADNQTNLVIQELRLPRTVLAVCSGAALAAAGALMQGLFRNPLADPSLIGVSSGAATGACAFIVLGGIAGLDAVGPISALGLPLTAFATGLGTTWAVYCLSLKNGKSHVATMLLAGIAINALAGSLIGFMIYVSEDHQLREFVFWTLGRLDRSSWREISLAGLLMVMGTALAPAFARPLNAFLLGESDAFHLGVRVHRIKVQIIVVAAAMVSASVAVCGTIAFVGLVVPHMVRSLIGPDHRFLIPASAIVGAGLLVLTDITARLIEPSGTFPLGVVTALVGAPFFLGILLISKHTSSE